jgi:hypothetical protein
VVFFCFAPGDADKRQELVYQTKHEIATHKTLLVEGGINHVLSAGALRIMQQAKVALLCTDFRLLDRWMDMIDIGLVLSLLE